MKYFNVQPADRPVDDNFKKVVEPWTCQWEYKGNHRLMYVPCGYIYDGASVPRIAWTISGLRPDGEIRAASLVHDVLYRSKGGTKDLEGCRLENANGNNVLVTRSEADWVLREFMKFAGMKAWHCFRAWYAVRMFGIFFWGRESPSGARP